MVDNSSENFELRQIAMGEYGQVKVIFNTNLWTKISDTWNQ
jgi:hypothetical protein